MLMPTEPRTIIYCPHAHSDHTPCCARDGRLAQAYDGMCLGCEHHVAEMFKGLVIRYLGLRERVDRLERAATAAQYLCLSLLAERIGATDALIESVREALHHALQPDIPNGTPRQIEKDGADGADARFALLAACKAQHWALDMLLAERINSDDPSSFPTQSVVWPVMVEANAAIRKAEARG
jgi:hypothetical protein